MIRFGFDKANAHSERARPEVVVGGKTTEISSVSIALMVEQPKQSKVILVQV
jgi:hypothetical protein